MLTRSDFREKEKRAHLCQDLKKASPAPTHQSRKRVFPQAEGTMSELLATVSGAEVKVWRPDAQVRARRASPPPGKRTFLGV
jgi:hypothetical protein